MHKLILIAITIVAATFSPVHAQSLLVGTVELQIGMPESEARRLLNERYTLSSQKNAFTIADRRSTPPNLVVGRIGFNGGKVAWISRDMGPRSPKEEEYWTGRTELASELLAAL